METYLSTEEAVLQSFARLAALPSSPQLVIKKWKSATLRGWVRAKGWRWTEATRAAARRAQQRTRRWRGVARIKCNEYPSEFCDSLRRFIHVRARFACVLCGSPSVCAHHVDYDKHNNGVLNLVALCRQCHGMTNQKREHWTNMFKERQRRSSAVTGTST
jgi:5-methylcytosine-specific restriction endonuclease McrA